MTPKAIHDEVLKRFPEIASRLSPGDEELPYLVVSYVADWLSTVARPMIAPQIVSRVADFHAWAQDQPRGESAADDVFTIVTVGFLEHLFRDDALLPLIPRLMTRDDMLRSREYLSQWVGRNRYEKALVHFGRKQR